MKYFVGFLGYIFSYASGYLAARADLISENSLYLGLSAIVLSNVVVVCIFCFSKFKS